MEHAVEKGWGLELSRPCDATGSVGGVEGRGMRSTRWGVTELETVVVNKDDTNSICEAVVDSHFACLAADTEKGDQRGDTLLTRLLGLYA